MRLAGRCVSKRCDGINILYTERYTRSAFLYRYKREKDEREAVCLHHGAGGRLMGESRFGVYI
jgi:hypothetical protein